MTDKDVSEREAFRTYFPQASLFICLFHTLRSFRCRQDGNYFSAAWCVLAFSSRHCVSHSSNQYTEGVYRRKVLGLTQVTDYFMKSWHSVRQEWVHSNTGCIMWTFSCLWTAIWKVLTTKWKVSVCGMPHSNNSFMHFSNCWMPAWWTHAHYDACKTSNCKRSKATKDLLHMHSALSACSTYNLSCQLSPMGVDGKEFVFRGSAGEVKATLIGCSKLHAVCYHRFIL